jgi:cathepsin D
MGIHNTILPHLRLPKILISRSCSRTALGRQRARSTSTTFLLGVTKLVVPDVQFLSIELVCQAKDQTVGAAWMYSPEFNENESFPPDGLSGLAFPEISEFEGSPLIQTLDESGKLPQSIFGFKLSTTPGHSEMNIGGTNTNLYRPDTLTYVPVTDRGYWQVEMDSMSRLGQEVIESRAAPVIIDTGTTFIITSYSIAQSYYANISGATAHTEGADTDTYWTSKLVTYSTIFNLINVCICPVPCDTINSTVPTITFGRHAFEVSAQTYNLGPDVPSGDCLAGIAASSEMSAHNLWYLRHDDITHTHRRFHNHR